MRLVHLRGSAEPFSNVSVQETFATEVTEFGVRADVGGTFDFAGLPREYGVPAQK